MADAANSTNVIFILTDDQGPWAAGCYGSPEIRTPNIDRLAATGVRLTDFFCTSPVCSPARASLMTGAIPSRHGVHDWLKEGNVKAIEDEIRALKAVAGDKVLKVIIETCQLTDDEKIAMCHAVTQAGADFIKTSTGFSTGGATREDVKLFADHIGDGVFIKAAGGIRSIEDAEDFIALGASRLGTSSIVKIVKKQAVSGY